ncbi:MAG: aminotransferase class V-fold PLP-dependent enzyme [Actinomycetota bacterium]|nr:aminotransferase class V-fold PLP-dependent enzyme [Actinomycetota bacterium]
MAAVHDDLLALRDDYPVLARTTYLASHTLGAMHRETPDRLAAYTRLWAERGVVAWDEWMPEMTRVADLVGSLVGAPAGTTVMRQNVADILGDVITSLDWSGERNRLVTSALDWPGSLNTFSQLPRLGGQTLVIEAEPDGIAFDLDRMLAAIDERTLLVACSHVLFRTSTVVDVAALVRRAHEVGALCLVDGYQAAGTLPVDVVALGADVYLGGSVKYLSGGPGNGWLYAAPDVSESLRPVTTGWFGTAAPFAFDPELAYAPGVMRFAGGTPGVPAAYAAAPAYEALAGIGIARVRERSQSMTQPLVEAAIERGFTVRSPVEPTRRGGHVTIDPGDSQAVHDELHSRGFVVDHRPGVGIRVSPHFYNTLEETLSVLDAMADIRAGR